MAALTKTCLLLWCLVITVPARAQENLQTPSQTTKEAVEKLLRAPATISKKLQEIGETVRAKLGEPSIATTNPKPDSQSAMGKTADSQEGVRPALAGRRDPFRPFTLNVRSNVRRRENLSPLERYELGQLKLVGVILNAKEPTAMVEDSAGLGYVVKVGTPIGASDGTVKAIKQDAIIIEEFFVDLYGARKRREVNMRISAENGE